MSKTASPPTKKRSTSVHVPSDDLSRSVLGFVAAMIVGAIVPKTLGYLVRRVFFRAFKDVFILALAGWLADLLASSVSRPDAKDATR